MTRTENPIGEECQEYIEMCRDNLEVALGNLTILMPANEESIMALSIGVSLLPRAGFDFH